MKGTLKTSDLIIETHVSVVLLFPPYAYKLKKPVRYSFLDFSTLKKRKYYCEREVKLNNRLSRGIYLGVVPVRKKKEGYELEGKGRGKIVEYAVKMKYMDPSKQMHRMLAKGLVRRKDIEAIAKQISDFHRKTDVIKRKVDLKRVTARFNDILSVKDFVKRTLGARYASDIERAVKYSDHFLSSNENQLKQRIREGFIRDGHGDLHSRNIFLLRKPVIFDCIEFNDEFRQIDVLNEIAFFCMDLEAAGYSALSQLFLKRYLHNMNIPFGKEEENLFTYYKCLRANIRAKVNALRAMQEEGQEQKKKLKEVKRYLALMKKYI